MQGTPAKPGLRGKSELAYDASKLKDIFKDIQYEAETLQEILEGTHGPVDEVVTGHATKCLFTVHSDLIAIATSAMAVRKKLMSDMGTTS